MAPKAKVQVGDGGGMNAWPWTRTMHSILTIAKLWAREALGLVGFKRIEIL
jgi:hypothetical protein